MEGEVGPRGISERPLNKNTEISSAGAFPKPSVVIQSLVDATWTLIKSCWLSLGQVWTPSATDVHEWSHKFSWGYDSVPNRRGIRNEMSAALLEKIPRFSF